MACKKTKKEREKKNKETTTAAATSKKATEFGVGKEGRKRSRTRIPQNKLGDIISSQ